MRGCVFATSATKYQIDSKVILGVCLACYKMVGGCLKMFFFYGLCVVHSSALFLVFRVKYLSDII